MKLNDFEQEVEGSKRKRWLVPVIVLGACVIIGALVLGFFIFRDKGTPATAGNVEDTKEEAAESGAASQKEIAVQDEAVQNEDSEQEEAVDQESLTDEESEADEEGEASLSKWKDEHTRVKGVYVTGPVAGSERLDEILSLLDQTELNSMVIDVKNDEGAVTFVAESGQAAELGCCINYIQDMPALMAKLKEHNVYTIARIVCFKDPKLAEARPELALRDTTGALVTDGAGLSWVNPTKREVWEYIVSVALMCKDMGFDEIQYDYVRFPVVEEGTVIDFGVDVTPENKHEYIEEFLRFSAESLHAHNMPVTVDLFGTVMGNPVDVERVGQDYTALASIADAVCPMIYPSHYSSGVFGLEVPDAKPYETILAALGDSNEALSGIPEDERAVVRPWLQSFTADWIEGYIPYGGNEIRAQIDAVYAAGYDEWILWNAKNNYSAEGLEPDPDVNP